MEQQMTMNIPALALRGLTIFPNMLTTIDVEREASIRARTARRYRQSLRILRGNPSASAKAFAEALESLRKLGERREDGE